MDMHIYTCMSWYTQIHVCISMYIPRHACVYMHVLVYTMYIHGTYVYVPFCQIMSMWSGFQMFGSAVFARLKMR